MDYPKPGADLLPNLYDHLDQQVEIAEHVLRAHFEIEARDGHEIILFCQSTTQNYLDAMYDEPETMVPFFMKMTGLTRRVFGRVYGIGHVDHIKKWSQKDLRKTERGQALADAVDSLMPPEMYLETALYTFYKMWEKDKRPSFRREYENVVIDQIQRAGYSVTKDEKIFGKPDLAIPSSPPYEVLGEVRSLDMDDFQKRVKNFKSEAQAAKRNYPKARFIVVAKIPQHQLEEKRENLRRMIIDTGDIDLVIFHDEMDKLFDTLSRWGVPKQSVQSKLTD